MQTRILNKAARKLSDFAHSKAVQERLATAGMEHALSIHTYTKPEELSALMNIAGGVRAGGTVVEIGSYVGASTCFIVAGLSGREYSLVCVDTWQNETMPGGIRDTLAEFKRNLAPAGERLQCIQTRSEDLRRESLPKQITFAFIDGDHRYSAVKRDFGIVAPLIEMDGIVAFHDTEYFQGPSRVLGEALASGEWRLVGRVENLAWIRRGTFMYDSETSAG